MDKVIDPNDYDAEDVKKIIKIALLCTQALAATRPTMSEVVSLLKSKSSVDLQQPTMPAFIETNMVPQEGNFTDATDSISILSAR